ncbi:MAG TPA: sugar ABC transporter substrate-binding protein [Chloroflexota bacterium]|nr:sugar ABC transporter substrate-binding protein [Chloroflexota bacterium]
MTRSISRKRFLRGSLVAVVLPLVAACGQAASPAAPTAAPTVVSAKPTTAATSPTAAPATAPTSAPKVAPTMLPSAATSPSAKASGTVIFTVPGGAAEDADYKPMMEGFAKKYPNIKATYSPAGTGYTAEYNQKIETALAGNAAPDVFKTLVGFLGSFAERGVLKPLDAYVKGQPEETDLAGFFPAHVDACKYKGQFYALPHDGAPQGMWYDVDMFKKAGLDLPTADWTMDQLLSAGKAMTKRDAQGRASQFGLGPPLWLTWIWSFGGDILDEEKQVCVVDQPPAIAALTWMQTATAKDKSSPLPAELRQIDSGKLFTTGRLGTMYAVRATIANLLQVKDFTFDAAPIPTGKEKRLVQLYVGYSTMWSKAKDPDAAYTFLSYWTSAEGQRLRISRQGLGFPSRAALVDEDWYKNFHAPKALDNRINTAFSDTLKRGEARAWPPHPKDNEIFSVFDKNLDALFDGSRSPEQVAGQITTSINALLKS